MATTAKAISMLREIRTLLVLRLPSTYVFTDSFDANQNPVLSFNQDSSWAAGEQKLTIRVAPVATPSPLDGIGLTQRVYTPHEIEVCAEESATSGVAVLTAANLVAVLGVLLSFGAKLKWYHTANTVDPTTSGMIAGNLKATYSPDIWNPVTNQQ